MGKYDMVLAHVREGFDIFDLFSLMFSKRYPIVSWRWGTGF
jgi:hypothetical protein